jgi:hypothetical protein
MNKRRMKKNIFLLFSLMIILLAVAGCNIFGDGTKELKDYPFETIYGNWHRIGDLGGMGMTYLKAHEDTMEWTVFGTEYSYTYDYEKIGTAAYSITWYSYDSATGESDEEPTMELTLEFEDADTIYLVITSSSMGGMNMSRD